jgi:hypothetical protein
METGTYPLSARQGSTFNLSFTIATDGDLWDLTGYTASMQVRKSVQSSTAILSLTNSSGITLGGAAGSVAVTVSATKMASLPAGTWVYDLELTAPNGTAYAILQGKFVIKPEVTR